jgi:hypothetical protein
MKLFVIRASALICLGTFGFTSCKYKANRSETKTLDDLAAGKQLRDGGNLCTGNPNAPAGTYASLNDIKMSIEAATPADKKNLEGIVAAAMTALPNNYIEALAALDVKIVVTPRSDKICKLGTEGYGKLASLFVTACSVTLNPGSIPAYPELEGISLVMAPSSEVIRHNLVRIVGQLFSQVYAQRLEMKSLNGKFQFSSEEFLKLQISLATAFLVDITSANKLFKIETLEPLLGPNAGAALKELMPLLKSGKVKDPFAKMNMSEEKISQFLTHVTSNSFDSFYCRSFDQSSKAFNPADLAAAKNGDEKALARLTNTRMVFEKIFANSYMQFAPVEAYMSKLATDIAALKPKSAGLKPKSAGLTGGEGFGLQQSEGFWSRVGTSISNGAYIAKEGVVGVGRGAYNIGAGTYDAGKGLVTGVAGIASTAYNEGVGTAVNQVGSAISHHSQESYNNVMKEADRIGGAYQNGQIGLGTAAGRMILSAGSNTPLIGNAAKSFNNSWDVLSETNSMGKRIGNEEQSMIAQRQGQVAGSAIVEAGTGAAAEYGGTVLGSGLSKATNAAAGSFVRGTGYVADAMSANSSSLSGFGQVVARGAENAAFSMEQGLARSGNLVGHAAQHNIAAATHVIANEGFVVQAVHGAFSDGGGHGESSSSHESAPAESEH